MGSLKYVLDSVIIIDHLNNIPKAMAFLDKHKHECALTPVTVAEVLTGIPDDERDLVQAFLARFKYLDIDAEAAVLAASLRRRYRWKLPDAFQASLSLKNELKLVTRNTNDFDPTKLDFVLAPYKLT